MIIYSLQVIGNKFKDIFYLSLYLVLFSKKKKMVLHSNPEWNWIVALKVQLNYCCICLLSYQQEKVKSPNAIRNVNEAWAKAFGPHLIGISKHTFDLISFQEVVLPRSHKTRELLFKVCKSELWINTTLLFPLDKASRLFKILRKFIAVDHSCVFAIKLHNCTRI